VGAVAPLPQAALHCGHSPGVWLISGHDANCLACVLVGWGHGSLSRMGANTQELAAILVAGYNVASSALRPSPATVRTFSR
jgi:hypothetical protein